MVPASISGHLLHVKCRAGCGHTHESHTVPGKEPDRLGPDSWSLGSGS